jgi:hypothetical protein
LTDIELAAAFGGNPSLLAAIDYPDLKSERVQGW